MPVVWKDFEKHQQYFDKKNSLNKTSFYCKNVHKNVVSDEDLNKLLLLTCILNKKIAWKITFSRILHNYTSKGSHELYCTVVKTGLKGCIKKLLGDLVVHNLACGNYCSFYIPYRKNSKKVLLCDFFGNRSLKWNTLESISPTFFERICAIFFVPKKSLTFTSST